MDKIILIDDKSDIPNKLKSAIKSGNPDFHGEINVWNIDNMLELVTLYKKHKLNENYDSNADEDVWMRVLESEEITMVVVDHDLSGLDKLRISESAITSACKQAGIPVCTYHRKPPNNDSQNLKDRINQTRSFSIEIEIDEANQFLNASSQIMNVFNGFKNLLQKTSELTDEILLGGPAKIISTILGKPELESFFARFTASSTLAFDIIQQDDGNDQSEQITETLKKRLPFILGCWLYNYVLPFPGVILNEVAAASYINLNLEQFKTIYSSKFEAAQYKGPFSDGSNYWWRYDLDQIFFDANVDDAIGFLSSQGESNILPCKCYVNNQSPAGYYCLVKQQPISFEQSEGYLSWIPEGADLCRINKKIYRRLAPMMGL